MYSIKLCRDCKYLFTQERATKKEFFCSHPEGIKHIDLVTGYREFETAHRMRDLQDLCGPRGVHFEAKI